MNHPTDKDLFVKYLQENKGIVFKICNSYFMNKAERDDLAQEIIYQLWQSFHTYHSELRFTTWMYRVALNVAISFYRKGKSALKEADPLENYMNLGFTNETDDDLEHEHETNRRLLHQFIRELDELDRSLMILFLEAKNYKEIAEIVGITESNVGTRINRIKEKLKQKFITYKK